MQFYSSSSSSINKRTQRAHDHNLNDKKGLHVVKNSSCTICLPITVYASIHYESEDVVSQKLEYEKKDVYNCDAMRHFFSLGKTYFPKYHKQLQPIHRESNQGARKQPGPQRDPSSKVCIVALILTGVEGVNEFAGEEGEIVEHHQKVGKTIQGFFEFNSFPYFLATAEIGGFTFIYQGSVVGQDFIVQMNDCVDVGGQVIGGRDQK